MPGSRLAAAQLFYWIVRGRGGEDLPRVMAVVALAPPGTAARARALTAAAYAAGDILGDWQTAAPLADEGLAIWRALGDVRGIATAMLRRGFIAGMLGDQQIASALLPEALARFQALGGQNGLELPTNTWLADTAQAQGNVERAEHLWDEVLAEARADGDGHAIGHALRERARLRRAEGDSDEALALSRESAALMLPLKDVRCGHVCVEDLQGCSANADGRSMRPTVRVAETLRELMGRPLTRVKLTMHERDVAAVQRQLDPSGFASAWAEGRAMTLDQGLVYALEVFAPT